MPKKKGVGGATGKKPAGKRGAAAAGAAVKKPSAAYYVGYVDDDESIESIMKKFAAVERMQKQREAASSSASGAVAAASAAGSSLANGASVSVRDASATSDGGTANGSAARGADACSALSSAAGSDSQFTERELEAIFMETSMFRVEDLHGGIDEEELMMQLAEQYEQMQQAEADAEALAEAEAEAEANAEPRVEPVPRKKGSASKDSSSSGKEAQQQQQQQQGSASSGGERRTMIRVVLLTGRDGMAVRKRVRIVDPREPEVARIATEDTGLLPQSWGRVIRPFGVPDPLSSGPDEPIVVPDVTQIALVVEALRERVHGPAAPAEAPTPQFMCIVVDPPWEQGFTAERLARLTLPASLLPRGVVFVWTPKQHICDVVRTLRSWGCAYCENLVWVHKRPNNRFVCDSTEESVLSPSKWVLVMGRRRGSVEVERESPLPVHHQRSPDVVFDFVRYREGRLVKPEFVFQILETLLVGDAVRRLYLWAPRWFRRAGWTAVCEARGSDGK